MATAFTFVSVNLNDENIKSRSRKRAIAAKDSVKIRSMAATSSWNRRLPNEDEVAWRKRKTLARNLRKSIRNAEARAAVNDASSDLSSEPDVLNDPFDFDLDFEYQPRISDVEMDSEFVETYLPPGASRTTADKGEIIRRYPELADTIMKLPSMAPLHLPSARCDPFNSSSVPWRPFLARVMHHRFTALSPSIPGIDEALGGKGNELFMTEHAHEPAYLFADFLIASSHLYLLGGGQSSTSDSADRVRLRDIMWLKGCALTYVNSLIQRGPLTAKESDCAIAAIVNLGLFELAFGRFEVYSMHMEAVRQLFSQRGGLKAMPKLFRVMFTYMAEHIKTLQCLPEPVRIEENASHDGPKIAFQHIFAASARFASDVLEQDSETQTREMFSEHFDEQDYESLGFLFASMMTG